MGRIRERPPRQVLLHHPFRPETPRRRNLVLAAPLRGDWARARALGGRPEMNVGALWARLKGLMRRREFDEELQTEIAAHLELATAENLRRGMPPEEARRLAAVRFGSVTSAKEGAWDERGLPSLASCLQDARYACLLYTSDA